MNMHRIRHAARQLKKRLHRRAAMLFGAELPWSGHVQIVVRNADGSCEVHEVENIITNAGKNLLRDGLQGAQTDSLVRWVALGNGSTSEANTQTQLAAEQFRKAITKFQTTGLNPGQLQTVEYIAPGEANTFTITEIGWFATPTATATANSGVMIARVLLGTAITKTALQSIQITRTDSIG